MSNAMEVEALLETVSAEVQEKQQRERREQGSRGGSNSEAAHRESRGRRDRSPERNRDSRSHRDRSPERNRDSRSHRESRSGPPPRSTREFNDERNRSRENGRRRRDDSRPRSSTKDTNSGDEDNRDRHLNGDYYVPSGRVRSRSPRRDDRDRPGPSRPRNDRDRSRSPRHGDDHSSYRNRDSNGRNNSTMAAADEGRDQRTIFVQQISVRAENRHLRRFFEVAGPVADAQIVTDRITNRSKGVGYVEFKDEASVPKAIALTGQSLRGVPIIAQLAEAEKNRVPKTAAAESKNSHSNNQAPFHRLYIGNIHFSVSEDDLREVFLPYGAVDEVSLQKDEAGNSRGYGYVQYNDPAVARFALDQMQGFELAARQIRVGLGNDKFTPESTAQLLRNFSHNAIHYQGSAFSGAGGRGSHAGGLGGNYDRAHTRDDRGVNAASALDDTDVGGISFQNVDRTTLMKRLARETVDKKDSTRKREIASKHNKGPVDQPKAGRCIKIQNAFDAQEELNENGPDWVQTMNREVKCEMDRCYGRTVHVAADPSSDGDIYVKFLDTAGGKKAYEGLNGRSFNERKLRSSYVVDHIYNSLFPASAKM